MTPRSPILATFLSFSLSPRSSSGTGLLGASLRRGGSETVHIADAETSTAATAADVSETSDSFYVFLQKFPLESTFKKLFHTEVIVCPRESLAKDAGFLNMLDGIASNTLLPPGSFEGGSDGGGGARGGDATRSPFVVIEKDQWSKQNEPGCVQLGFGYAACDSPCCGSPHRSENKAYALNSKNAVIANAMGEYKELYFYGVSGGSSSPFPGISGEDAYEAVCHGHMYAIDAGGTLPTCVSDWAGTDYNPLTNNCNTFTSALLKCVYGMSDVKPNLGISDLRTVTCPSEKGKDGMEVKQCVTPAMRASFEVNDAISVE
ncbi:hypothetical protein ACHAXA_008182 [Cyclostephanos tholiformis]|uniref:Uncharacterized protein n=1 Tax=Cyclostephanos tholiformis TaxID=382380 RepID=A0ABD3SCK5_9STRA